MHFSKAYTLVSPSGMEVTLLEAGAAVAQIRTADRNGAFANVALSPKGLDDLSCAGSTLAPYAGRIAEGRMEIDGTCYQLSRNEGRNQNHGGFHSLLHAPWRCEQMTEDACGPLISFSAELADGTDGFPGNRRFTVLYRLLRGCQLEITLAAETDRPTRVNLSNHTYFNLSGDFSCDVSRHLLTIASGEVYLNDEAFLMIARETPPPALDFSREREIGAPDGHPQLMCAKGLNHCYVLRRNQPAASLICPDTGRRMRLYTNQPCLMVYSGGYLDTPNSAVALEALEHPLSPCAKEPPVLYPGMRYQRRIVYHFDTVPVR